MHPFCSVLQTYCNDIKDTTLWVAYRKGSKIPVNPRTGKNTQNNNPKTWASYEEAMGYYEAHIWWHKKRWEGRRVELNAMGSQQFIDFLERKFQQHGVKKVVPDQKSLENAYIRAFRINAMQKEFMEIADRINKIEI